MNFLEAISAGKPFKRPKYNDWIIENKKCLKTEDGSDNAYPIMDIAIGSAYVWKNSGKSVYFFKTALLAEDWEVKE